jgi:hypothetical protein
VDLDETAASIRLNLVDFETHSLERLHLNTEICSLGYPGAHLIPGQKQFQIVLRAYLR